MRWVLGATFVWVITWINLRGISAVAQSNTILLFTVLGPFIAMVIVALFNTPLTEFSHSLDTIPNVKFGTFFTALLWNTCGYDSLGPLAGEVHAPAQTYPRAVLVVVGIVTAVYAFPIIVGSAVDHHYEENWRTGYWVVLAENIGGPILSAAVSFSAATCSIGLYMSLLAVGARQLCCQAQLGLAPSFLGAVGRHGVPTAAILIYSASSTVLIMVPFASLVEKSAVISVLLCLIQFASLVAFRWKLDKREVVIGAHYLPKGREDKEKEGSARGVVMGGDGFRIPLSLKGIMVVALVPCIVVSSTLFFCSFSTWMVGVGMVALTHLAWHVCKLDMRYKARALLKERERATASV